MKKYLQLLKDMELSSQLAGGRNSRVLIVDGLNTFIRSYSASPTLNGDGEHVGGISGTLLSIGYAIKELQPTRVLVVFDGKGGSSKRRSLFADYKKQRKVKTRLNRSQTVQAEDNELKQLVRLIDYLEALPYTVITVEGAEADDSIAYIANELLTESVIIMSSDKDFLQLVNGRISVWDPIKKLLLNSQSVFDRFGVHPVNLALFRAIVGDSSDNIPGVKGIGAAKALQYLPLLTSSTQVTLDALIAEASNQKQSKYKIYNQILEQEKDLRVFYEIAQLSDSMLNSAAKSKIRRILDESKPRLAKLVFYRYLNEDKMNLAIKNVEGWLRDVTTRLDSYNASEE